MEDKTQISNIESNHEIVLNQDVAPVHTDSPEQVISFSNSYRARLSILQLLIGVAAVLCLVFILGKLINQYDLTSICVSWNCAITQNAANCAMKHLLSLGAGGAFGLFSGIGATLFIPAGIFIAPAMAGLLIGAGIFGGSTLLLELLIQC